MNGHSRPLFQHASVMYCTVNIAVKQISNQLQGLAEGGRDAVCTSVSHISPCSSAPRHKLVLQKNRRALSQSSEPSSNGLSLKKHTSHLAVQSVCPNFRCAEGYYSATQANQERSSQPRSRVQAAFCSPKQLHANLQCEMSIRLLISEEGSPLIRPKVVEVILSQTFSDLSSPNPKHPAMIHRSRRRYRVFGSLQRPLYRSPHPPSANIIGLPI